MARTLFKIVVSLGLLILISFKVDLHSFLEVLSHTQWNYFTFSFIALLCLLFIPTLAQKILFNVYKINVNITQIYKINLKGMFYSLILPGDVAGGMARLIKFSKAHRKKTPDAKEIISTILTVMAYDRFLNMGALILPVSFLLFIAPLPHKTIWFQKVALLSLVAFVLIFILAWKFPLENLSNFLLSRYQKIKNTFDIFIRNFRQISLKPSFLSFSVSFIYQIAIVCVVDILLAKSLGLELPWLQFISIAALIRFLRYIPITVSGIGLREGLFPFFLQYFSVSFESALTFGVLGTILVILVGILGGVLEIKEMWFKNER